MPISPSRLQTSWVPHMLSYITGWLKVDKLISRYTPREIFTFYWMTRYLMPLLIVSFCIILDQSHFSSLSKKKKNPRKNSTNGSAFISQSNQTNALLSNWQLFDAEAKNFKKQFTVSLISICRIKLFISLSCFASFIYNRSFVSNWLTPLGRILIYNMTLC